MSQTPVVAGPTVRIGTYVQLPASGLPGQYVNAAAEVGSRNAPSCILLDELEMTDGPLAGSSWPWMDAGWEGWWWGVIG